MWVPEFLQISPLIFIIHRKSPTYLFAVSLQIVKEKDRFRKAPPNYAMKKTQLLKDKVTETIDQQSSQQQ